MLSGSPRSKGRGAAVAKTLIAGKMLAKLNCLCSAFDILFAPMCCLDAFAPHAPLFQRVCFFCCAPHCFPSLPLLPASFASRAHPLLPSSLLFSASCTKQPLSALEKEGLGRRAGLGPALLTSLRHAENAFRDNLLIVENACSAPRCPAPSGICEGSSLLGSLPLPSPPLSPSPLLPLPAINCIK